MLLLIDNYDSFTYNLVHYLGELGAETVVYRNDALTVQDAIALRPDAIVISPGPCDPDRAGITLPLVRAAAGRVPGARRLPRPSGDRPGLRRHDRPGAAGDARQAQPDRARRHRRLRRPADAVRGDPLPFAGGDPGDHAGRAQGQRRTADGTIMGLRHTSLPIHGVQFHPESIETQHGHRLLRNFLELARAGAHGVTRRAAALQAADRQGRDRRAAGPGRGRRGVRA